MNQQTATTIAGSAASEEAAMQIQQNQDLNAEKKSKF